MVRFPAPGLRGSVRAPARPSARSSPGTCSGHPAHRKARTLQIRKRYTPTGVVPLAASARGEAVGGQSPHGRAQMFCGLGSQHVSRMQKDSGGQSAVVLQRLNVSHCAFSQHPQAPSAVTGRS